MKKKVIQEQYIDTLKEIVNIGSGNAATALSQILNKKVTITVPSVNIYNIEDTSNYFGGAGKSILAIYLELFGDGSGIIIFPFDKDNTKKLAKILLNEISNKKENLDEMEKSILSEISIILSGAYLNAIAKLLKMKFSVTAPVLKEDMIGAIIDNFLIEYSKDADYIIIIDTFFIVIDEPIKTSFVFIPDKQTMNKLIEVLKIK